MEILEIKSNNISRKDAETYALKAVESELNKKAVKIKRLGGGSYGIAYKITTDDGRCLVVKLLKADNMMPKETHDLELLGKYSTIKIPQVLFKRRADEVVPLDAYGMELIDGKCCMAKFSMLLLSAKKRRAFAEKVTEALHSIHECKNDKFGDTMNPNCTEWLEFYKPFAENIFNKAEEMHKNGKLSAEIIDAMRTAWNKFDKIFEEKVNEGCLIHGDLNVANIMVGKRCEITGFIDPLNSMYADREYDLFQFNNLTGKRFYLCDIYLKKYGASRRCDAKLAFYGLWNEVYCYIKSGCLINFIMNPLVKNMHKQLGEL